MSFTGYASTDANLAKIQENLLSLKTQDVYIYVDNDSCFKTQGERRDRYRVTFAAVVGVLGAMYDKMYSIASYAVLDKKKNSDEVVRLISFQSEVWRAYNAAISVGESVISSASEKTFESARITASLQLQLDSYDRYTKTEYAVQKFVNKKPLEELAKMAWASAEETVIANVAERISEGLWQEVYRSIFSSTYGTFVSMKYYEWGDFEKANKFLQPFIALLDKVKSQE